MENEQRPTAWHVGDLIGQDSEVRGILGEGGMGTVYKVYNHRWNREMAVKRPRPELFAQADGKARFIQEAETWMALGAYPYIVEGYFVRVVNGIPHVFAEYVSGGSLADWIGQRWLYAGGPEQALSRILDLSIQVAWGLHFAHERGLVHQDVKPANVMMTMDGTAKVTDFGLARARQLAGEGTIALESGKQSLLVSSRGMTPAYCSPEQAAGRPLTRRTDLWSWGLSVLEMFAGEVNWRMGVEAWKALTSYQRENLALPEIPADVMVLLERCFQQEPAARPATMLDVASELQQIFDCCVGRPYPRVLPQPVERDASFLVNWGASLQELGRPEEALAAFEQALRLDPNCDVAHSNRGNILQVLGRPEEALAAFEQALRLNPNYTSALQGRGAVLVHLGRPEEALAAFEQALHLNPNDARIHYNRGVVLVHLGRQEEALAAFEQALRLYPNYAFALQGREMVLRELGRPEKESGRHSPQDRAETMASRSSFALVLPQTIYQEMVTHVMNDYPHMACGMLGRVDGRVVKHYPTANVAANPKEFFQVGDSDMLHIYADLMDYDGEPVGYVSYPTSPIVYPSKRMIEAMQIHGWPFIIFSLKQYPERPSCRVFTVDSEGSVTEGKLELI